jgi:hypothetical protein
VSATIRKLDDAAILFFIVPDTGHIFPTTVLDHVPDQIGEKFKVGAIDDRPAFPPGENQPRVAHVRQVEG